MKASDCNSIKELMIHWKNKADKITYYYDYDEKKDVDLTISHRTKIFISDGIIDSDEWRCVPPEKQILFIFKEAYSDANETKDWPLDEWIKSVCPKYAIWYRVCEWIYGLINSSSENITKYKEFNNNPRIEDENITGRGLFRKVAVMNIKKSNGRKNSIDGELREFAEYDKEEIIREIELVNPSIIICGGTFDIINEKVFENCLHKNCNDKGYCFSSLIGAKERLFIDYYHPACQYPAKLSYYGLMHIYQEALQSKVL